MRAYLNATGRAPVARAADKAAAQGFLSADEGAEYDQVIEIVRIPDFVSRLLLTLLARICLNWSHTSMDPSPPI
jgi:translation elongation factor EF-Ts